MRRGSMECLTAFLLLDLLLCFGMPLEETDGGHRNHNPFRRRLSGHERQEINSKTSRRDIDTPLTTVPMINPTKPATSIPIATSTMPNNPTTPLADPNTNPVMGSPGMSSGQSWCIASQTASQISLQVALDYACGYGGADCSTIQPGSICYDPNTMQDHASFAFNSYYQKYPVPTSCDFGGNAVLTNVDPSTTACKYPSTSTTSSILNTSNQPGSRVFGSAPLNSSTAARKPVSILTLVLTCIPMAVLIASHL